MKKSTLLVIVAMAALLPSDAFAASITVDDSEYGQQLPKTACVGFADFAGSQADCFQSLFTNPNPDGQQRNGYLVSWSNSTTVGDVEVTFSNLTVGDFGLVICGEQSKKNVPCGDGTSTGDLDTNNPAYPNLFSSTAGAQSVVFDVNGIVQLDPAKLGQHGNIVAFLVLSDDSNPTITVRSLAAAPIPEPTSLLLLSSGVVTFLGARRRKR